MLLTCATVSIQKWKLTNGQTSLFIRTAAAEYLLVNVSSKVGGLGGFEMIEKAREITSLVIACRDFHIVKVGKIITIFFSRQQGTGFVV